MAGVSKKNTWRICACIGVVARARRVQGRVHDSVIKLRPVVPAELPR